MIKNSHNPLFFNVTITPNRSLSPRGFMMLMSFFILYFLTLSAIFMSFGWWPIIAFLGLDVLGVWIAFKVNFFRLTQSEKIELSADQLKIAKISPRGKSQDYRYHPMWVRLGYKMGMEENNIEKLFILHKQDKIEIASVLSQSERYDFYRAFQQALVKSKSLPPIEIS